MTNKYLQKQFRFTLEFNRFDSYQKIVQTIGNKLKLPENDFNKIQLYSKIGTPVTHKMLMENDQIQTRYVCNEELQICYKLLDTTLEKAQKYVDFYFLLD